jgi:hypothetical protein
VRLAGVSMRGWKALLVLSILVSVGLFAGFKLTGMISGPAPVTETVHLQPAVWTREEPYMSEEIPSDPFFNASYVGDDVILVVSHWCGYGSFYEENSAFWGGPMLWGFGMQSLNVSVPKGFIVSVEVAYREACPQSSARFAFSGQPAQFYGNLTLSEAVDRYSGPQVLGENKVYVKASAVGQPRAVYMGDLSLFYHFSSPYNYTHHIMIDVTVTYFNGTIYKQLVQPVELVFGPDHNNSFDEAEEIGFGTHRDYVDDSVNGDPVDYFKIYLQEGQKVNISVLEQRDFQLHPPPRGDPYFYLPDTFVYDQDRSTEACMLYGQNTTYQMVLAINQTGWWYVKVITTRALYFLYGLDVSLVSG